LAAEDDASNVSMLVPPVVTDVDWNTADTPADNPAADSLTEVGPSAPAVVFAVTDNARPAATDPLTGSTATPNSCRW
jgi:hypothetical protein